MKKKTARLTTGDAVEEVPIDATCHQVGPLSARMVPEAMSVTRRDRQRAEQVDRRRHVAGCESGSSFSGGKFRSRTRATRAVQELIVVLRRLAPGARRKSATATRSA